MVNNKNIPIQTSTVGTRTLFQNIASICRKQNVNYSLTITMENVRWRGKHSVHTNRSTEQSAATKHFLFWFCSFSARTENSDVFFFHLTKSNHIRSFYKCFKCAEHLVNRIE